MNPLEPLTEADIPEVMRIERTPGYEGFVGRFEAEAHAAGLASPDERYFGFREGAGLAGFAILQEFRQPVVLLRRICASRTDQGVGGRLLRAVMDRVFETTPAEGLRLNVALANDRARHLYEREGFTVDGVDETHHLMSIPRSRWAELRGR